MLTEKTVTQICTRCGKLYIENEAAPIVAGPVPVVPAPVPPSGTPGEKCERCGNTIAATPTDET